MTVTDNAKALAQAVLSGNAQAVAGLIDEVLAEGDLGPGREWVDLWSQVARDAMAAIIRLPPNDPIWVESEDNGSEHASDVAFDYADDFMKQRAARLRSRAANG